MAMKFARMMCGSKEARVGGSISPSKFLDIKSFHRSSERVSRKFSVGYLGLDKTLTKLSETFDHGMVVIENHVSFHPGLLCDTNKLSSPVGSGKMVESNQTLTLVYSNRLDSLNNIILSVVCALPCQKLQAIQVSMASPRNQVEQQDYNSTSVSGEDTQISCDKCSSSERNTWLVTSVSASS